MDEPINMEKIKPSDLKNNALSILHQVYKQNKSFIVVNECYELALVIPINAIEDAIDAAIIKERLAYDNGKRYTLEDLDKEISDD